MVRSRKPLCNCANVLRAGNRGVAMKIAALGILFGVLAALFCGSVKAHEDPDNWIGIERRTNAAGVLCCGKGDCTPYTVDQVKVMPDGYHFPDGEIVPFN